MRFPPRDTELVPGSFVLPEPREADGRLVFREPVRDTLLPLAAVGGIDLSLCVGVAVANSWTRLVLLLLAAGFSFLVAALLASLFRRPEVVLDRARGVLRVRRPEHATLELPLGEIRAVTLETVRGGGREAPAAGVETREGEWLPLLVGWTPRRGGDAARVRSVAARVASFLDLPLRDAPSPAAAG